MTTTAEERLQIALGHAYRHLSKRDRTEGEVRTYLAKRETDPVTLEAAITELRELKYVDDERYAQRYIEDRRRLDGWGPRRIEQGLSRLGLERRTITAALETSDDAGEDDPVQIALTVVERRFQRRPLVDDRDRQRALRAIVAKGHSLDVAYAAVRSYAAAYPDDG